MFDEDPRRFASFSLESEGLLSRLQRQLHRRARARAPAPRSRSKSKSRAGSRCCSPAEPVNNTEDRPALHVALRRPADRPLLVDGAGRHAGRRERAQRRCASFADALHAGELTATRARPFTDIVNIGIGGSDLGIVMAVGSARGDSASAGSACTSCRTSTASRSRTCSQRVEPETTLFVICSKTFTTLETLTNAQRARVGCSSAGGAAARRRAVRRRVDQSRARWTSSALRRIAGSRCGTGSAGAIRYGRRSGSRLRWRLAGATSRRSSRAAHAMDEHFAARRSARNLPVLLALIGVWNRNFLLAPTHAVLPYDEPPAALPGVPATARDGEQRQVGPPRRRARGVRDLSVIWGEPGSNAQHSFYQLLHQGTGPYRSTSFCPSDRVSGCKRNRTWRPRIVLAQAWALAEGDPSDSGSGRSPHQRYLGNRPSSLILFDGLDATTLGKLVALYEHKVYVQGVIWDVNSFDQWGVQLGKRLASELTPALESARSPENVPAAIGGAVTSFRRSRYR